MRNHRLFLAVLLSILTVNPALAHSLRLFARIEGSEISGYAFFVGGGRPDNVVWIARTGGKTLTSGRTDDQGRYRFTVPAPVTEAISVTVDTGEGHIATTTLSPERFGGAVTAPAPAGPAPQGNARSPDATAMLVEQAVERQVAPLLERIEAMDARLRFTDLVSGVFLIIGLAGMALWARSRKR